MDPRCGPKKEYTRGAEQILGPNASLDRTRLEAKLHWLGMGSVLARVMHRTAATRERRFHVTASH
jgi:hypothetical protein